jgi:hypothetical protein
MDWHLLESEDALVITLSAEWRRRMEVEELKVWLNKPNHIYIARERAWVNDMVIATPETFLILAGYTDSEDINNDEELSLTIALS